MTPLTRLAAVSVPPIAVLISLTHLVGAADSPGDGFTAGIISSLGLTLQYITLGYAEARRTLRTPRFQVLLGVGLGIGVLAATLPLLLGQPLLALLEIDFDLPLLGQLQLTRAMLFDLGVFLVVLGGTMTAIDSLGRAIE